MTSSFLKQILFAVLLFLVVQPLRAQEKKDLRFYKDIQNFLKQDQESMPEEGQILLIGSSSFTKWKDVSDYFPNYSILNRGFGGSTFADVFHYMDDVVYPYKPTQILVYCGDNDAVGEEMTADSILNRFKKFYRMVRTELPRSTKISFVSIKPSPSRAHLFPVMEKANWEISEFLKRKRNADFIDVWHLMLDDQGQPMEELFLDDMLHMNAKGYMIWQNAILPHLKKES